MQGNKMRMLLLLLVFLAGSARTEAPHFGDFRVDKSRGPFAHTLSLTNKQKKFSDKWRKIMQRQLNKPVNFAGHYRVYLTRNGELPKECGSGTWVCGWVLDKHTGKVVSTLPEFNGNTAYRPYSNNGTSRPNAFEPGYYPFSTMFWVEGTTMPADAVNAMASTQCAIIIYNFKNNKFTPLFRGECKVNRTSPINYLYGS